MAGGQVGEGLILDLKTEDLTSNDLLKPTTIVEVLGTCGRYQLYIGGTKSRLKDFRPFLF
jgi:hypothetical protein